MALLRSEQKESIREQKESISKQKESISEQNELCKVTVG
jgi:hypothetical protein